MSLAIIHHPDCELHLTGEGHPERPQRVNVIQKALEATRFNVPVKFYLANEATHEQLALAHDEDYIDRLFQIVPQTGLVAIDADTIMSSQSLYAAQLAAGAVTQAVDLVMNGEAKVVFCNIRPPGHHAEQDKAMGFCFFNNVGIGVLYAQQHYHIKKIAIIDFDVHHGNGTQDIFQYNKNVLLCSSFEYPQYPGYVPANDNEHILNLPLAYGTQGESYRKQVAEKWFAAIDKFAPELIFFSAGFDAHVDDPLAGLQLEKADYVWLSQEIKKIADKHCNGKMISVLEGGYNLEALADCVPAHINALASADSIKGPK